MQVNSIWVHKTAQRWRAADEAAYNALRDNFCANVEAGAWILRAGLDEAQGDLWKGVAFYHSHSPEHKRRYLGLLWQQVSRLDLLKRAAPSKPTRETSAPRAIVEASR